MNVIQRAFDLARSGECRNKQELERQLRREGFSSVEDHLSGHQITGQLRTIFAEQRDKRTTATSETPA